MWKLSFNKIPEAPRKVERFNGKTTVVTLTASINLPKDFIVSLPPKVFDWAINHSNPLVSINFGNCMMVISAKGKTIRNDDDEDQPLLGERIAEYKAKMKIYGFMEIFLKKYLEYYNNLLLGKDGMIENPIIFGKDSVGYFHGRMSQLWTLTYGNLQLLLLKLEKSES